MGILRNLAVAVLAMAVVAPVVGADRASDVAYVQSLDLSPDGTTIAFNWQGDIWSVAWEGGVATRLTINPGEDFDPQWSPDGTQLTYSTDRHGNSDIYLTDVHGREHRRLTHRDTSDVVFSWMPDGEALLVGNPREYTTKRGWTIDKLALDGSTPLPFVGFTGRNASLSPDGTHLLFERGNNSSFRRHYRGSQNRDLWVHEMGTENFRQLTTFAGNDMQPQWGPEGREVFYLSERSGSVNLWRMSREEGEEEAEQLTFFTDHNVRTFGLSADAARCVFTYWDKVYTLEFGAGDPVALAITAPGDTLLPLVDYKTVSGGADEIAPSPTGEEVAIVVRGDVYVVPTTENRPAIRVTDSHWRDRMVEWSADGRTLYFVSDQDDGVESIFAATPVAKPESAAKDDEDEEDDATNDNILERLLDDIKSSEVEDLPKDLADDVTEFHKSWSDEASTDTVVLLRAFFAEDKAALDAMPSAQRVQLDVDFGQRKLDKTMDQLAALELLRDSGETNDAGEKIARLQEIFSEQAESLAELKKRADERAELAARVEKLEELADEITEAGEEAAEKKKEEEKDEYLPFWKAWKFDIARVTDTAEPDSYPSASPDGRWLGFIRGRGQLVLRDLETGAEKTMLTGWDMPNFTWSPDSRWLAYGVQDDEYNNDVWIMPVDGSREPYNVTQHPDYDGNPQWSGDGKMLAFVSKRRRDDVDLYFVFLDRKLEEVSELELTEYFEKADERLKERLKEREKGLKALRDKKRGDADAKPARAAKPSKKFDVEIDFDGLYKRERRLNTGLGDQYSYAMHPNGSLFLFTDGGDLHSIKWDGTGKKSLGASVSGGMRHLPDGKRAFFLSGGRPSSVTGSGSGFESHRFSAPQRIDYAAERAQKFDDASRIMGLGFYHPTMKGLDWAKVSAKYRKWAMRTTTTTEFNDVFSMLLGELNASHMGISGGPTPETQDESTGYLGVEFDGAFEGPGLRIAHIIPKGPADRDESRLEVGDVLLRVDGRALNDPKAPVDLYHLLLDKVNREVALEVQRGMEEKLVFIRPISSGARSGLLYDEWVAQQTKWASEWSDGRLAYAHIRGMGINEAETFERDLYAVANRREGLIIDVRNNGGGWTADIIMNMLETRNHAFTISKGGGPGYPQDRRLVYSWTRPAAMMCNENSFSNAEIVSHAFKNLGRGPLVGTTTAGGVISTGGTRLIDGTSLRTPFRGWFTLPGGVDMENNGAEPTHPVALGPVDELRGDDPQLREAVRVLLELADAEKEEFAPELYDPFGIGPVPEVRP